MSIELWTPNDLYELRRDDRMDDVPSHFLDTYFTAGPYAEDGEIRFGDLEEADRFLAPFVLPYEQGRPISYSEAESVEAFRLPYIKPKGVVRPEDARNLKPSEIFRNGGEPPSLQERFDARVAELDRRFRRMIHMRKAWMAARAFIDASVQIDYERDQGAANPSVLLNFGRAANQNLTLLADFWDDPATPILDDLEEWLNIMYLADGGGSGSDLIVGAKVAPLFRKNNQVKDMLDTRYRGGEDVSINRGIQRIHQPMQYIGQLDSGLKVWTYKDTVDIPTVGGGKARVDLFNEKDILLVAPGSQGIVATGPIYDTKANEAGMVAEEVFVKMWETEDPGERHLMAQASFLPINTKPNRQFKARVLA